MFLKRIKLFFRQVSVKITLSHLGLFIISFCFLFEIFFLRYSQELEDKDHQVLEATINEYQAIYHLGGLSALSLHMASPNYSYIEKSDFFIRIESSDHHTKFFRSEGKKTIFNQKEIEAGLGLLKTKDKDKENWIYIKTKRSDDDLEVLSKKLLDGNFLQVGKTVEDRDLLLDRFEETFIEVLILAIFLGGVAGVLLSNRLLRPLRGLVWTLQSINKGEENARVPVSGNNDELEELTEQFNEMLDHITSSNQAMRQTLDIAAHELRTPLTSIRAHAEINLQKKNLTIEENKKFYEDCIEGIDEILSDFKMLTDITEVESGLQNLKKEKIEISTICKDIIDLYEFVAEEKNITIVVKPDRGSEDLEIYVNRKKIRQALANLIDNAIKYSEANTEITINFYKQNQNVVIRVTDQGIGILPNELPHIWKRLYRGENSRFEKGIGLGLSLVKSIIEAHNGSVSVENNIDSGSTFNIILPIF